ncbi:MAG: pyridoxal phosphate-dependent aminotransferase [Candidatus Omnitrophica bacterium]|nr:pyridoxal phosphate-dependent aminotransferase [Candidatus Omnitrophota bacterium]
MKFSRRTEWPETGNALTRLLGEKLGRGEPVIDLTETNPTRCGFDFLDPEILGPLGRPENLRYEPDPHGLAEARLAVSGYYRSKGIAVAPEQVFLTAGTSEAYSFILRLLCDAGEGVLAPTPGYPLLDYLAAWSDVELLKYPLRREESWRMEMGELDRLFAKRPKGVLLVNPNNPTGNFLREEEIARVSRLCLDHGAAMVSDEVFIDFKWRGARTAERSLAGHDAALTFTLNGISKMLGLPQMKLSWIVVSGPPAVRASAIRRLEVIADTFLSVSTPSQRAFPEWMARREAARREILERVEQNLGTLRRAASAGGAFKILPAEGGWHAVIRMTSAPDDEKFALRLLRERHVFIHPGYFYDIEEPGTAVLSFLTKPAVFEEGLVSLSVAALSGL